MFAQTSTDEVLVIIDIMNDVPIQCLDLFVKSIENEREKRWKDKKKKKKEDFYIQVTYPLNHLDLIFTGKHTSFLCAYRREN